MNPFRLGKSEFRLEELLEFNDLLVSVVKGQTPMIQTLQVSNEKLPGRLSRIITRLIESLNRGCTLSESLDEQPAVFHRLYRQTVRAGEDGGFLGAVLESFSAYLWQLLQIRRRLGQAMLYPLLVTIVSYLLLIFIGGRTTSSFLEFYRSGDLSIPPGLETLNGIFTTYSVWMWIFPILLGVAWISWMRSNDSRMLSLSGGAFLVRIVPGISYVLQLHRLANFAELLAAMMERQVPFTHALQVAAKASGDQMLIRVCQSPEKMDEAEMELPPFLKWLLSLGAGESKVGQSIDHAAQMYRRRAEAATEWVKVLVPFAFLVFIGGGATLFYVVTVFFPFTQLLHEIS